MRVLYVSKALVTAAYRDKLRELERAVAVTAVVPERWSGAPVEASDDGVPEPRRARVRLPGHNHLHSYPGARRWMDAAAPDLVHIDEEPYSLVTLQLAWLARRRGTPALFFAWQNLDRRLPPPFGRVRAAVFRMAAGGIAGTEGAAAALRRAGFAGPLAVVPQFGVDPDRFRPDPEARDRTRRRLGLSPDAFVVGYAGRLVPEKGVRVLLDAFAHLPVPDAAATASMRGRARPATAPDPGPAERLVLIGDGAERGPLVRAAARLGVGDRVHVTGRVPSTRVPAEMAALDVLVLPTTGTRSWTEQFGRVLVEAMACGVPVIGSDAGEIPGVIGDAGEIVPAGDARALATAIARLRDDLHLRDQRAGAGRRRVLERFTQRSVADRTVAFYADVAAAAGGR